MYSRKADILNCLIANPKLTEIVSLDTVYFSHFSSQPRKNPLEETGLRTVLSRREDLDCFSARVLPEPPLWIWKLAPCMRRQPCCHRFVHSFLWVCRAERRGWGDERWHPPFHVPFSFRCPLHQYCMFPLSSLSLSERFRHFLLFFQIWILYDPSRCNPSLV